MKFRNLAPLGSLISSSAALLISLLIGLSIPRLPETTGLPLFMILWPTMFVLLIAGVVLGIIYSRPPRQATETGHRPARIRSGLGLLAGGATVAVVLAIMKGAFRLP